MERYAPTQIRNVALVAHSGAGKTSLAEALYYVTGKASRLGKIEDGNTISDFDPDEIQRRMSINVAVVPCEWRQSKINVLDTPGYADFIAEVICGLHAADTALVVLDASAGIQVGTETVWKLAAGRNLPRWFVLNRMDRENVAWGSLLDTLRARFGAGVAPLQMPIGDGHHFVGLVDLLDRKALMFGVKESSVGEVPAALAAQVDLAREQLVDAIVATDDALLEKYLEGQPLERQDLEPALKAAIRDARLFPVCCTAATTLKGARELLDALVALAPSPADLPIAAGGAALTADPSGPVVAQVFKTIADPYVGKSSLFRVFSGTVTSDAHLVNAATGATERISNPHYQIGKEAVATKAVVAGDIASVTKLEAVATGDTLTLPDHRVTLPKFVLPSPLYYAAITPQSLADLDKMGAALERIAEEDPSLHVSRSDHTSETILAAFGESHVQISLERIRRKFGTNLKADVPQVAYRETIRKKVQAHGRHKRQTGGHGQFGDVHVEFEPLPRGAGFVFEDRVVGGHVPRKFIPAVEKGLTEAITHGLLAGYLVVDMKAALFDGSYHQVDSSDEAFRMAARLAYHEGYAKAEPIILEPIVKLAITIPDAFTGDVIGDISGKRGHVLGMNAASEPGMTTVEVEVPEAEVQRYATDLRSITQGRGVFTRAFVRYQEAPGNVQEKLVALAAAQAAAKKG